MMRLRETPLLSGLMLLALVAGTIHAADKADLTTPAQLVERLGSTEFTERQDAMKSLDALNESALPALKLGLKSDDMEVRRRCDELIQKIELRLESARMIQPKRVHLIFKDTPLTEALADFGRKAACTLELGTDPTKFTNRKITLDTGMVPFWEAMDKFCVAAGLIEVGISPPTNEPPRPGSPEERILQIRQQQAMLAGRGGVYYSSYGPGVDLNRIVLVDGKQPTLPTFQAGSLRIRQLPKHVQVTNNVYAEGEKSLPLEVVPEPGMAWLGLVSVKVQRAVDEHGQSLVQPVLFVSPTGNDYSPYQQMQIWNGDVVYSNNFAMPMNPTHAPLRLKAGEKEAKLIKELQGTVTGQIQTPPEPLIVVDNILKASGKIVEGTTGGTIKINEVKEEAKGRFKVKVVVEPPAQDSWSAAAMGVFGGRQMRINRAVMQIKGGLQVAVDPSTLELRDERGVSYQALGITQSGQPFAGVAIGPGLQEMELAFQANAGQGPPSRLVYIGRRTVTIDVPFSLKDLSLQ